MEGEFELGEEGFRSEGLYWSGNIFVCWCQRMDQTGARHENCSAIIDRISTKASTMTLYMSAFQDAPLSTWGIFFTDWPARHTPSQTPLTPFGVHGGTTYPQSLSILPRWMPVTASRRTLTTG